VFLPPFTDATFFSEKMHQNFLLSVKDVSYALTNTSLPTAPFDYKYEMSQNKVTPHHSFNKAQ
jgi:hypothetical protein